MDPSINPAPPPDPTALDPVVSRVKRPVEGAYWERLATPEQKDLIATDLGSTMLGGTDVVVIGDADSEVAEPEVHEPEFEFNPTEGLSLDKFPDGSGLTTKEQLYARAFVDALATGKATTYIKGTEGERVVDRVIRDDDGNVTHLVVSRMEGTEKAGKKKQTIPVPVAELEESIARASDKTRFVIEPRISRVKHRSPVGIPSEATIIDPIDASSDVLTSVELPRSFSEMRPEGNTAKVMKTNIGGVEVDLRQSSMHEHQDGVAYNPNTGTVVVCDGLGGVGREGDVKDHFAFALAHATAEVTDISTLSNPDVIASVVERAKIILVTQLGITVEKRTGGITSSRKEAFASTIAAIQNIEGTKKWRVATIGDSSVVLLGADGKIRRGFGEAFQQLAAGKVGSDGTAEDAPLSSVVGISKDTLAGIVRYESTVSGRRFGAEFTEVELLPGEKLVVASDAYIQKTAQYVLERDALETADTWKARAPRYSDDTTIAIVG